MASCIKYDWLHVVTRESGIFFVLLDWVARSCRDWGSNMETRVAEVFRRMQVFYTANGVTDRLNNLKVSMLRTGNSPELTASAAELRSLIPFFLMLVNAWPAADCTEEQALMQLAMRSLHAAYGCLSTTREEDVANGALEREAFEFHRHLVALHALNPDRWVLKPKLHLFLEIGLERSLPSKTWLYRDESLGGNVARQAPECSAQILREGRFPQDMSPSGLILFFVFWGVFVLVRLGGLVTDVWSKIQNKDSNLRAPTPKCGTSKFCYYMVDIDICICYF